MERRADPGSPVDVPQDTRKAENSWRDARVITLHGALNLEALSENYGRLLAGIEPHKVAGITTLDRFAPAVS